MLCPGLLASQGIESVEVRAKPRIAIISTGNELVKSGSELASGQVKYRIVPSLAFLSIPFYFKLNSAKF